MTVQVEAGKTTMDALLENIARGDQVELQQNGRTVATLTPAPTLPKRPTPEQTAQALAALGRIDERVKRLGLRFDFDEFKADKEYGRR